MDWTVSFKPNDTFGMSKTELDRKINPKVVLNIRLGKGFVGTAIPVLVENMSFKGRIRIKFQLMSKMPHVRLVEACFMEKPLFDYVLKPVGGETFGFDVNNVRLDIYIYIYKIDQPF
jgi:Ca2+-dependent lipid-binding protein